MVNNHALVLTVIFESQNRNYRTADNDIIELQKKRVGFYKNNNTSINHFFLILRGPQ